MGKLSQYKLVFVIAAVLILTIVLYIAGSANERKALPPTSQYSNQTEQAVSSPFPSNLPRPVELVRENLSLYLDVPVSSIKVKSVEEVIWPDKCLGLPGPELCARGETPGYKVVLKALDQEYVYHTNKAENFGYAGPGDFPKRP